MDKKKQRQYTPPEIEVIFVTADAVLASGESGGFTPPKQEEDEGEFDVFSLG